MMSFSEAMNEVLEGETVSRKKWLFEDYIRMEDGMVKNDGGSQYFPNKEDMEATDWHLKVYGLNDFIDSLESSDGSIFDTELYKYLRDCKERGGGHEDLL